MRRDHVIESIVSHESYNDWTLQNDIAVIKLTEASQFGYAPIDHLDQPGDGTWHEPGTPLVAAGWGTLSAGGSAADTAQHVVVPAVPDCWETGYGEDYDADTMVCAGAERGSTAARATRAGRSLASTARASGPWSAS